MVKNIDERYHKGADYEFYCPENANWMSLRLDRRRLINTYPMLALGDDIHLGVSPTRSTSPCRAPKGRSGYYDTLNEDGNVLNRDAARNVQGIGLTRKNADVLYWMVKQFARCSGGRRDAAMPSAPSGGA